METRATYITDREMAIDPRPDVQAAVIEAVAAEKALAAKANADEPQPAAQSGADTDADTEIGGKIEQLETLIAARDREIADLHQQLSEAQQRAALPPFAGNPAPAASPGAANGYSLIRAAIEQG